MIINETLSGPNAASFVIIVIIVISIRQYSFDCLTANYRPCHLDGVLQGMMSIINIIDNIVNYCRMHVTMFS